MQTIIPAKTSSSDSPLAMLFQPKNTDPQAASDFLKALAPLAGDLNAAHPAHFMKKTPSDAAGSQITVETQIHHRPTAVKTPAPAEQTGIKEQTDIMVATPPALFMPDLPRLVLPADAVPTGINHAAYQPVSIPAIATLPPMAPTITADTPAIQGPIRTPHNIGAEAPSAEVLHGAKPVTTDFQVSIPAPAIQVPDIQIKADPVTDMADMPALGNQAHLQTGAMPSGPVEIGNIEHIKLSALTARTQQPDFMATAPSNSHNDPAIAPEPGKQQTALMPAIAAKGTMEAQAQEVVPEPLAQIAIRHSDTASAVRSAQAATFAPVTSTNVFSASLFTAFGRDALKGGPASMQGKGTADSLFTAATPTAPALVSGAAHVAPATGSNTPESALISMQPSPPGPIRPLPVPVSYTPGLEMMADSGALSAGTGHQLTNSPFHASLSGSGQSGATPQTPGMQVGLGIVKATANGTTHFTIRMDPPNLGRIEVKLQMLKEGGIHALIMADTPETLDLLQRDSQALERMLGESGIKTENGSLNFSLNQNAHDQHKTPFADHKDGSGAQKDDIPAQYDRTDDMSDDSIQDQMATLHWHVDGGLNIVI